jgi:hypothetical protein
LVAQPQGNLLTLNWVFLLRLKLQLTARHSVVLLELRLGKSALATFTARVVLLLDNKHTHPLEHFLGLPLLV